MQWTSLFLQRLQARVPWSLHTRTHSFALTWHMCVRTSPGTCSHTHTNTASNFRPPSPLLAQLATPESRCVNVPGRLTEGDCSFFLLRTHPGRNCSLYPIGGQENSTEQTGLPGLITEVQMLVLRCHPALLHSSITSW